jgi:hypothetical protein
LFPYRMRHRPKDTNAKRPADEAGLRA